MALVLLRSLLFPNSTPHRRYSLLSPETDLEKHHHSSSSPPPSKLKINPRIISDLTIGLSDGLTVPFALTAGLSALGDPSVVIYGGFAELIAGGISMGLGGYLGAKSEAEAYAATLAETRETVSSNGEKAEDMVRGAFERFGFGEEVLSGVVGRLRSEEEAMVEFLMRFVNGQGEGEGWSVRAYVSGLTISMGYMCGGLVALMPYLFFTSIHTAFMASVFVMALALFAFGWLKTSLVGETNRMTCFKNGVQMLVLGGVAAGAAMGCVKAIGT